MAKGLSDLQQEILRLAYKNRKGHPGGRIDTCPREILVKFYGFAPTTNIDKAKTGALIFNREIIGIKRYQAASVSVAKSFDRLVARGLAEREYNYGIKLTPTGIILAKALAE